jgi:DNA polymerase elongation subunit (family B)|tara:strand:+ start:119 stop:2533 length:2415 start_codon:yes stop_codon:yes gene_type:complete
MKFDFVPVDYDYFDFEGHNYIRMIGRSGKGEKICVIDSYEPNFYVILKDEAIINAKKISDKISKLKVEKAGRITTVLKTEILDKKFLGKSVKAIRVYVTNHKDAQNIASEIKDMKGIEARREYDIPLISKYIKEKKVNPLKWHEVSGNNLGDSDFGGLIDSLNLRICILANKISLKKDAPVFNPKILAYDIETTSIDPGKGEILMISVYGENFKRVFTWKNVKKSQNYVESFKDEGEMIEGFVEAVNEYGPDILTGYFSDGFDLPYLKEASKRKKVKLLLGVDGKEPVFSRGRIPTGRITGIVHVDLYRFISAVFSQYLQSESLSLNDVAKELVGESKEDFDFSNLSNLDKMDDESWREFFSYNLQDSVVTYKLAEKIWPDIYEFTMIVKDPLFDVTRNRMAALVEGYILHNLDRFDEIAEKRPIGEEIGRRRAMGAFEGAYVSEPNPGIYGDLVMFDFTSMYASVIVSYNLSKSTLLKNGKFSKKEGFFPVMLLEIIEKRKIHKKEHSKNPSGLTRARSNAYKLLANASYGYQAFFGARYYSRESAASTAKFARENILKVIGKIKKAGYKIIYSDTDSIAFLQEKKSKKEILDLLEKINKGLPGIMELDLEDFYSRAIFVSRRGGGEGAKKKYALIRNDGSVKIRGFETVRRDWCKLARNLQSEILKSILKSGNEKEALKTLKVVVKKLKSGDVPLEDLIIKTQLKKQMDSYLAKGPHVVAAKRMQKNGVKVYAGMMIRYFIGEVHGKTKRIGDKVFLPEEKVKYDSEYYLNNQVLPAVGNIFEVFGIDVIEVIDGERQNKLF